MRRIVPVRLYLQNFKSFIQPTTIALSQTPGLKFLGGKNLQEPRLGSNGAGKSTVWDGITWTLYGTGVHGQRASDLASWGKQAPHGKLDLDIDGTPAVVERRGSPNRLGIDGKPATQEEVDRLLGLNRDRFLQAVMFGQGAKLFLDLPVAARGELLDAVLDLGRWVDAADAASRSTALLGQRVTKIQTSLSYERGRLAGIEDEAQLRSAANDWQAKHDAEFNAAVSEVEEAEVRAIGLEQELEAVAGELAALADLSELDAEIEGHQDILHAVKQVSEQIRFYDDHSECPTCQQPLTDEFIQAKVAALEAEIEGWLAPGWSVINAQLQECLKLRDELSRRRDTLREQRAEIQAEVVGAKRFVGMLVTQAEAIGRQENPYAGRLADVQRARQDITAKIADLESQELEVRGEQLKAEFWKQGFKRVRLFQVRQVLQRMEVETANAAGQLGIVGWKIRFATETETKSGSMRPGVQVLVSTPRFEGKWEHYSGGEAQRVRLAVTLGIAAMIQSMAGVSYGFEVWDEASQYLSSEGIEDLLTALSNRASITDKSIWVCDHTLLSYGGFDESWLVTKDASGSRLEVSRPN